MVGLIGASVVLLYLLLVFYIYHAAKRQYAICEKQIEMGGTARRLRTSSIIAFSILFVLLDVYCTELTNHGSQEFGMDRTNYYLDFNGREVGWTGLKLTMAFVHMVTADVRIYFYFTAFVCFVIAFIAYRQSEDADPLALLVFLSTNYFQGTLVNMKQCYVNALACVFFCLIIKKRTVKQNVLCILIAIIATLFHSTGFVLIPLFIFFILQERSSKYTPFYIVLLVAAMFLFRPMGLALARIVGPIIPHFARILNQYFGDRELAITESVGFLKGLPHYALAAWGIANRRRLRGKIPNYDKYLFLAVLGAALYLYSSISYWFVRFTMVLYFPMAVFASLLLKNSMRSNRWILGTVIIGGNFFVSLRTIFLSYYNYGGF